MFDEARKGLKNVCLYSFRVLIKTITIIFFQNYFGKIELVSTRSLILQDILARRPVRYRVRFPLPDPIPKLSAIILNGRTICQGRQGNTKFKKY